MTKLGRSRGYVIGVLAAFASIGLTQITWSVITPLPFIWPIFIAQLMILLVGTGPGLLCAAIGGIIVERNFYGTTSEIIFRFVFYILLLSFSGILRLRYDRVAKNFKRSEGIIEAAAHELLQPLSSALLSIQVHKMGGPLKADLIEGALRRAAKLVDSMIELGRAKRNLKRDTETFDLVQDLRALAKLYCPTATVEAARPIPITCNRTAIEHVFGNLLSNAKKYGGQGPVTVQLDVETNNVIIKVADQGQGLDEEQIRNMFNKYAKFDTTKPGLGLGLWIVAENIKAMNGAVQVKSEKGRGTCIEVTLPLLR